MNQLPFDSIIVQKITVHFLQKIKSRQKTGYAGKCPLPSRPNEVNNTFCAPCARRITRTSNLSPSAAACGPEVVLFVTLYKNKPFIDVQN